MNGYDWWEAGHIIHPGLNISVYSYHRCFKNLYNPTHDNCQIVYVGEWLL